MCNAIGGLLASGHGEIGGVAAIIMAIAMLIAALASLVRALAPIVRTIFGEREQIERLRIIENLLMSKAPEIDHALRSKLVIELIKKEEKPKKPYRFSLINLGPKAAKT